MGAGIEHRRAGGATGAPILGDLGRARAAELAQELVMVELAQALLVQDGDLAPLRGVIEPVGVDVVELAAIPGDLLGARKGDALALTLDGADFLTRFGEWQRKRHATPSDQDDE